MWKMYARMLFRGCRTQTTVHYAEWSGKDLPEALAEFMASLDREVIAGLADAPLLVEELSMSLHFGNLVPRAKLSSAWIEGAAALAGVVQIIPEGAAVDSCFKGTGTNAKVEETLTVNEQMARIATPALDQEGGRSHG